MIASRIAALCLGVCAATGAQAAGSGYHLLDEIAGPDGGWDYVRVDPANNRVLVAHGGSVMAVDIATKAVTPGRAPGMILHDPLPVNGGSEVMVTNGGSAEAVFVNGRTFAEVARVKTGVGPDAAAFDTHSGLVLVMNHRGGDVTLIDPKAHQQRAGVLGSLGLVADSLRLLPNKGDGNGEWSATEWAETRQGWIFITSLPAEREALRPLQSLWIDLLVLRLLNEPKEGQKRAWFVIDELASLQKLPQLHTAITENRKSNNPVILGFQGKAQLEVLYGHLAEVMLSQPATSIWLKTKEPTAGEWVSKFIGKVEIERLRETHFDGSRAGRNFALDRQVEPLVMESEISGLPDLHAYMKYENYVTRFSFPYFDMPVVTSDFDLRDTPEDKLPYDPRNIGVAKPKFRPHELKPDANLPTPSRKSPRKATEIVPEETEAERNDNAQQSLNLRG